MKEEWRDIEGWEGYYRVSNKGKVKSLRRYITRMLRGIELNSCWRKEHYMSTNDRKTRYIGVTLFRNGEGGGELIHRLVASAFIDNPDNKPCVNHKDGNKHNNEVSNLEWCTPKENGRHAVNNGLTACGERQHDAKLTSDEVRYIRWIYKIGEITYKELGIIFGVGKETIGDLIRRTTWKHILNS